MSCLHSACAGYSGCNTLVEYDNIRNCIKKNCSCDIGPYIPVTTIAPENLNLCAKCGFYNKCDVSLIQLERQQCMLDNCGIDCKHEFDIMESFLPFCPL